MTENQISYIIRGKIYDVYKTLGPGLFELVYVAALEYEFAEAGLTVLREVPVPVQYKNTHLEVGFRLDLLVEDKVLIEVKSIASLTEVHHKQVLTYLRITGLRLGILVNFNVAKIGDGIFRKVNGL